MESWFLLAAICFGIVALVQSFRAYDAGQMRDCSERRLESVELRMVELRDELRRVEKEHACLVQKIIDFAEPFVEED